MLTTRTLVVFCTCAALAAFTFGCGTDPAPVTGGSGGSGGGGAGGEGGEAGAGGVGGAPIANFPTSLHNTRAGQSFWFDEANGGIEKLIGVPYEDFTCQGCHDTSRDPDDPNFVYEPSCADCHFETGAGGAGGMAVASHLDSATCLGCHGRQARENAIIGADVHTAAGFQCSVCHGERTPDDDTIDAPDVHGDGNAYDSLLRKGAISARCTDCHDTSDPAFTAISYHAANHAQVDCALCHTETVISCINCHLEEELDNEQKCPSTVISNWKFVMKWDKKGDGKEVFHPATMMTVKYNCDREADPGLCPDDGDPKKTFAVLAPYYAHTVTPQAITNIEEGGGCAYCHSSFGAGAAADICAVIENAGGANPKQKLIEFEETGAGGAVGTGRLINPVSGLIPLPEDYQDRFEVDFVEYAKGPGLGCEPPPEAVNVFFETGPDLWQTGADFPESATPRELGAPLDAEDYAQFCD